MVHKKMGKQKKWNEKQQKIVVKEAEGSSKKMSRTSLLWDNYWWAIEDAFILLGSTYRAADKPMAAMKGKFEPHLTNRLLHQINAAAKMEEAASRLYLNEKLAKNGMFAHDNGHPFSAHDGEEIFDEIGEIYDLCYFHHNERSVEVLEADELLKTALLFVKDDMADHEKNFDKMNEDQRETYLKYKEYTLKRLEEEFYYIMDITISHDGEASPKSLADGPDKRYEKFTSIKDIVRDKERRSKTKKGDYKFIAQTPEGMLGKYADVFAYLTTDIMDGYRLGIFRLLNDDYLEIYGKILSDSLDKTREEYIAIAKAKVAEYTKLFSTNAINGIESESPEMKRVIENALQRIEEENLDIRLITEKKYFEQQKKDMNPQNEDERKKMEEYFANIEREGEKVLKRIKEIASEELLRFGDLEEIQKMSPGERTILVSRTANNIWAQICSNSKTLAAITSEVSDYFMDDLVENSRGKEIPQLSEKAAQIYADAKHWGYKHYVPEVKTIYQKKILPVNTLKIIEYFASKIMEKGIIEDKLVDVTRQGLIPEEKLECINEQLNTRRQKGETEKSKWIMSVLSIVDKTFNTTKPIKETDKIVARMRDLLHKQDERFALTYDYLYDAIESRTRDKIEKVLVSDYTADIMESNGVKKIEDLNELDLRLIKELDEFRAIVEYNNPELLQDYKNNPKKYEQEKEKIIQTLMTNERKKIIQKMAYQIVCDYISGKTDTDIKNLAIELGIMTEEQYNNAQRRERHDTKTLQDLQTNSKYFNDTNDSNDGARED